MRSLRKALVVLVVIFGCTGVLNAQDEAVKEVEKKSTPEFRLGLNYYMPGSDDWDSGFGIDGKVLFWGNNNIAIAATGGFSKWDIDDDYASGYDMYGDYIEAEIGGDATLLSIGCSAIFEPKINKNFGLSFEAGFKYVYIDSNVDVDVAIYDYYGGTYFSDEIDIDSGVVGLIGIDLTFAFTEKTSLFLGGGFQFDISKGDAKWNGIELSENELKSFFVHMGIHF